ncbi:MAG: alpha/beta hydrolase [Candidatus Latescibacterota bacterium]
MSYELTNDAYQLTVTPGDREVHFRLRDLAMDFDLVDGPYIYRASVPCEAGTITAKWLSDVTLEVGGETLRITGMLAGLEVAHILQLPGDRGLLEERITLHNPTEKTIALEHFAAGLQRTIADEGGSVLPELVSDRLVAIPFRHRPTDTADFDVDFGIADLIRRPGREHRVGNKPLHYPEYGYYPSLQWSSEGWAWTHGKYTLGVFKLNQEAMEFSVLSLEPGEHGLALRFGGAGPVTDEPSSLCKIQTGQRIELGVTRYETVEGDYKQAYYAFRAFLDENGCRFPKGFDPPVHWNELYDNPEWHLGTPGHPPGPRMTRPVTYTKELILEEARKATEYGCESLYLDPGWDTDFGTFLWGKEWLGSRKPFIAEIQEAHGLGVSLHCPLATWMSVDGRGVESWAKEALQRDRAGRIIPGAVCLGSRQYLDQAAERLLAHCADGVVFLMFDGNWWNGGCWNPDHGHRVPYALEDHIRANVELARRVHAKYPAVLIEMHDMVAGGTIQRYTPVYYKYGLPGSYDENWGFELMWQPLEDICSGRARSLYYYNLGCNVPAYLHIDLRDDNEHCLVLWWYASTCRHLGIGGTHANPQIAHAQKLAMKRYRKLERFYKHGEFYGMNEEAHVHVLPDEDAFVVNLFNLSDEPRAVGGTLLFEEMGLDCDKWYVTPKGGGFDSNSGTFSIKRRMAPWSAQTIEVRAISP